MLSLQEKAFITWWEANRNRRKKIVNQLSIGLPAGAAFAIPMFLSWFSGWNKRADVVIQSNSSLILVIIVAILIIIVFVSVFSVRHRWDQHEQHYRELIARDKTPSEI